MAGEDDEMDRVVVGSSDHDEDDDDYGDDDGGEYGEGDVYDWCEAEQSGDGACWSVAGQEKGEEGGWSIPGELVVEQGSVGSVRVISMSDRLGGMCEDPPISTVGKHGTLDTHSVSVRKHRLEVTMINNYILLEDIGSGSFGEVKLCKKAAAASSALSSSQTTTPAAHRQLYAMKIIKRSLLLRQNRYDVLAQRRSQLDGKDGGFKNTGEEEGNRVLGRLKEEVEIMKRLNHPHIIKLFETIDDPNADELYIITEYMPGGDLMSTRQAGRGLSCRPMSEIELRPIVRQVTAGLVYLKQQGILHGDIKPHNLLLTENGTVKICDFGLGQVLTHEHEHDAASSPSAEEESGRNIISNGGTPAFMAPEVCGGEKHLGWPADVWAFGVTMYLLAIGHLPFYARKVCIAYTHTIQYTRKF